MPATTPCCRCRFPARCLLSVRVPPSRLAWAPLPLAAGCAKELRIAVSGLSQLRFRPRDGLFRTCDARAPQTPRVLRAGLETGYDQDVNVDDQEDSPHHDP